MSTTLYRKYRPQKFEELIGQNHIKITLQNEIETGRITHAYLFCGPRGIGKTTTARLLAKALNCEKRKGSEPCDKCNTCQEIKGGRSLDLIEIDAASHTGVDNVRENIIENARFAPLKNEYKVFIIDEVHMLSISAFNALLKILEEPPAQTIFILATTEVHKVPETIISRCQRFDFKKISLAKIVERLAWITQQEKIKVDSKVLENIAHQSEGYIRDAESLLGQILSLGEKNITPELAQLVIPRSDLNLIIEFINYLIQKNSAKGVELINRLVEEGVELEAFVKEMIEFLRKMVLLKVSHRLEDFSELVLEPKVQEKTISQIKNIKIPELIKIIELFLAKKIELKSAEIIQLPLELAVLEICEEDPPELSEPPNLPAKESRANKKKLNNPFPKTSSKSQLSLEKIKNKWIATLEELKKYNHSLVLALKVCCLLDFKDGILTLGFGFKFHKERINNKKNLDILKKIFKKILGEEIEIKCVVDDKLVNQEVREREDSLQNILDTFGDKVIEKD